MAACQRGIGISAIYFRGWLTFQQPGRKQLVESPKHFATYYLTKDNLTLYPSLSCINIALDCGGAITLRVNSQPGVVVTDSTVKSKFLAFQ